jgi:hypothetical protein
VCRADTRYFRTRQYERWRRLGYSACIISRGLSEHGYPSLFKNFKGEFIEPLADYGGGSGCGGLYLSEPGFPEGYGEALYTADWGREWIYKHNLTPNGATFRADQKEFVRAPRVTDLDVDAQSRIYLASWKGATFTYVGENVGFLVRVSPKGYTPEPLPDFRQASDSELLRVLESPSHRRRLEAQRELLARKLSAETRRQAGVLAANADKPLVSRIAAIFLLKQALGTDSHRFISELLKDARVREYAIRALCDRAPAERDLTAVPEIVKALRDENPRVRNAAAYGLERLHDDTATAALATTLGDTDSTVAHTGVQALTALSAHDVAFGVFRLAVGLVRGTARRRTNFAAIAQAGSGQRVDHTPQSEPGHRAPPPDSDGVSAVCTTRMANGKGTAGELDLIPPDRTISPLPGAKATRSARS